jgi:outer membrane biosynthesis protein TonB
MSVRGAPELSLRLDRREMFRLAQALALSLALHLGAWGTYELGRKYHVWENLRLPAWIQAIVPSLPGAAKKNPAPPEREPLVFINVSPDQALTEPPKNAKYYSSHSARAANPDATRDTDLPKITGTQTQVPKTEDVPREKFEKLQPAPPAPQEQTEAKPKPAMTPGDLALARPDPNPRPDTGPAEQPRPRTLKEALARQPLNSPPGRKMKQEGGVSRRAQVAMVDVKGTTFGAYDAAFIEAVRQRWYDLIESRYDGYQIGKVTLQFHLNYDGRITDMNVAESTVGDMLSLLCQKAVLDPAPYERWPREMRLAVGRDYRPIQFTFYYN